MSIFVDVWIYASKMLYGGYILTHFSSFLESLVVFQPKVSFAKVRKLNIIKAKMLLEGIGRHQGIIYILLNCMSSAHHTLASSRVENSVQVSSCQPKFVHSLAVDVFLSLRRLKDNNGVFKWAENAPKVKKEKKNS